MRQRRVAAGSGLSTDLSTTIKYVRRSCSSAECSSPDAAASCRLRQRSKHRPEHHDQVRATHSGWRCGQRPWHHDEVPATQKICRVLFSSCGSVARPQATVWAPAWAPRPRTCDRIQVQRLYLTEGTSPRFYLAPVHMRLVIFTIFLDSPAEFSSGNRLCTGLSTTTKHVRRTESSASGSSQVSATHKEGHRRHRPGHHDQLPVTKTTSGSRLAAPIK
jgi:hypothetical protein